MYKIDGDVVQVMLLTLDTHPQFNVTRLSTNILYIQPQYAMVGQPKSERFSPKPVWVHCIKFPQLQDT